MKTRKCLSVLGFALITLASCGGGGGGGGTSNNRSDKGLNQGSYDKDAFDYEDPYPAEFHPLQSKSFRAARREEIVVLGASRNATDYAVAFDDADEKSRPIGLFGPALFDQGFSPRVSAAGSLNPERGDDLAVLGVAGNDLEIVVLTAAADGQWSRLGKLRIPGPSLGFRDLTLELADLDGDDLDEFLVTATYAKAAGGWLRVYDDPSHLFRLLHNLDIAGSRRLEAKPFDADGDGAPEILVLSRESARAVVAVVDGAGNDYALRRGWTPIDRYAEQLVVGNFDADGDLEFGAVTIQYVAGRWHAYARTYEWTDTGVESIETAQLLLDARYVFDAVAVDSNGDRIDEIAASIRHYLGRYDGRLVHWSTKLDRGPRARRLTVHGLPLNTNNSQLRAHDANADGREDIALVARLSSRIFAQLWSPVVSSKGEFYLRGTTLAYASPPGLVVAVVATGDFDRENLVLRSTGRKWTDLPDPMPIVVMAAPPTKSGIDQNYDASATSYGTQQSTERSHGVSTGWTASFSTGFEASDIFDAFGVSVKQTLSWEMQRTLTNSRKITWTKTFAGSYDKDVIIFQGTLYQVYEYEIVSAENEELVGSKITLNDPVATKTYKWTVDFYNANVSEKARIGKDVITHEVGTPASYRRKADAMGLLRGRYGWMDSGLEVGAVRGGSNSTSVTITDSNSTETSRSFGIDWEAEVKIGGATIGGSFGLTRDEVYGVTVETGTTYAGEVGDIENTDQWSDWRYGFGLLVYRHGADAEGEPERGARPYHVITYWVDDLGPAHTR